MPKLPSPLAMLAAFTLPLNVAAIATLHARAQATPIEAPSIASTALERCPMPAIGLHRARKQNHLNERN